MMRGEPRVELAFAPAVVLAEEAAVILSAVAIRVLQARRAAAIISALENLPKVEPEDAEAEKPEEEEKPQDNVTTPASPPEPPEEDPKDILNPDGKPYGEPGKRNEVRIKKGGEKDAKQLYDRLGKGGKKDTPANYPGEGKRLPNGDWVGYRPKSKSGPPTVDVNVKGVPYKKIKFK
jgi:hypothetical protein